MFVSNSVIPGASYALHSSHCFSPGKAARWLGPVARSLCVEDTGRIHKGMIVM